MALTLTQAHIERVQAHAEQAYPHEGCGLLVGLFDAVADQKTLVDVVLLDNAWTADVADNLAESGQGNSATMTKARRYCIDPKDLFETQRQAREKGLTIIGVYHSHPDAEAVPSECDRNLAWSSYSYIIASVRNGVAVDLQNWQLDSSHQFQPEPLKIAPASAAKDRMPLVVLK
ncbi:mov34 mpn pad-1 family protein [Leptolyngbya sp. Heron Island J]|uniref:Mov34/MPN/PAD-1 family protein n=1 Tax=Leptolyngbya sp. Heron Island J TaxID=1385935 RepID=UPI0003B9ED6F|nr:M67 family metallopeptidase [Leptolyngbya sp. Heron Island J]ESA35908.1 mov34 mpn pad-1 family protein [Leptolyngbya sp. Heron Island J]